LLALTFHIMRFVSLTINNTTAIVCRTHRTVNKTKVSYSKNANGILSI